MFWFVVLPFLITVVLSGGVVILVYYLSRRNSKSRSMSVFFSIVGAGAAFVPICILVFFVTAPFRLGHFQAASADSVRFVQVRHYLPSSATDIEMITTIHHHHVRFRVSEKQLIAWMNRLWDVEGKHSPIPESEAAFGVWSKGNDDPEFVRLGMDPKGENAIYRGPYRRNWGGPTLWYDKESETAWQYVGYW